MKLTLHLRDENIWKKKSFKNINSDSNVDKENSIRIEFENLKSTSDKERENSINELYRFAERKAEEAKNWCLENKDSKSMWSRRLRLTAILLATLGGIAQLIIQKLKEFISAVDPQVEQETLAWISEFQMSLSDIERMVKNQQEATKHGAIDVTVTNGMETEKGFNVTLDGMNVFTI
tara:strand:+ start:661 stop:1191 length:531 start_codon:yes stop_codon:yes gene_type:complete